MCCANISVFSGRRAVGVLLVGLTVFNDLSVVFKRGCSDTDIYFGGLRVVFTGVCSNTVACINGRCVVGNGLDGLAHFNDLCVICGVCSHTVLYSGGLIAAFDRVCYAAASFYTGHCADFIGVFVDPVIFNGLGVVFNGTCSNIATYFNDISFV